MHLSVKQVERFYNIWFPLLHYANRQLKIVESFPAKWRNANVEPAVAVPLRDALWENDSLREAFIADNPAGLSVDDLALVASWKYRVTGNFFVFRYLKKYAIFLTGDSPARGYSVRGITGPIEEIIGQYLPLYVQTTLLPFKDCIIYDSLLSSYPILFGGGIRTSLQNTYRDIQEREGILTTLPPDAVSKPDRVRTANKKVLTKFREYLGQSGLSPQKMQEHTDNIADFAYDFLLSQKPPRFLSDIQKRDVEEYLTQFDNVNLISLKRFVRFLRDSTRMDWDQAEEILDFLKHRPHQ